MVTHTHTHTIIAIFLFHHLHLCLGVFCVCVCRKNNVSDFIPDRQPDFPDENFRKVTGDPFFVDESVLVKTPL